MTDRELQAFADNYTSDDFLRIMSDWNGKYGSEFYDVNHQFRIQLAQFLIPQIDKVNIELVRDIYIEETKISEATFCIYTNIHIYAQELLRRDWKRYLLDYLQGASYNMDSYLGTSRIEIPKEIAEQIVDYITTTLQVSNDVYEKKLLNLCLERFTRMATQ